MTRLTNEITYGDPIDARHDAYQLPASHQQMGDESLEPFEIHMTLLDQDDLPLAHRTAILPLLLGVGVFWPGCPMPNADRLSMAKCLFLSSGEMLKIDNLTLCRGTPSHYTFSLNLPWSDAMLAQITSS